MAPGQVAELPHVTAERFRERVLAQQALEPTAPSAAGPLYCQPCRKPFKTDAQHRNHVSESCGRSVSIRVRWVMARRGLRWVGEAAAYCRAG